MTKASCTEPVEEPEDAAPAREILVALVDDDRISRDAHVRLLNAEPGVRAISAEATLSVAMLSDERPDSSSRRTQ